jgi:hypothetical protein
MISRYLQIHQAAIDDTETVSNAVDLGSSCIVGFTVPASFDGANITFQVATTLGGTYRVLRQGDTGDVVTIPVTANTYVAVPYDEMQGLQFIKIVSDVAMTADRVVEVLAR